MKYSKQDIAEARKFLQNTLKPGDTLYTILRSVSRSGMSRNIDVVLLDKGNVVNVSWYIARALEYNQANDGSLKVGGCGMDMGFSVVHRLSSALFGEYQCTGKDCHSADHVNMRDYEKNIPPYKRDGKMIHKDGYAISQKWL